MTSHAPAGATWADDQEPIPTRILLERTALELFDRCGYDAVTASEIAEAAGFSERTFFRHFASKHEPLFGDWDEWLGHLRALLSEQPQDLAPLEALIAAVVRDAELRPATEEDQLRKRIVFSTPTLTFKVREFETALEAMLADWLAERSGRAPGDLEVSIVAAALVATRRVVVDSWSSTKGEVSMIDMTRRALATIDFNL